MKLTKCDNHPDRDAVASFYIKKFSPGARPLFLGYGTADRIVDLCEECSRPLEKGIK
jgi:hypothetical protein